MADLTGRDRGQILLVAALALAVTFVALALILNSAIFTENLASRGDTTGSENALQYRDSLKRGMGTVLAFENRNLSSGEGRAEIRDRLNRSVGDLSPVLTRKWARLGVSSNTSISGQTDGSRIFQTDHTRDFTDNDTNAVDWTLASGVDETRAFRLNVSRSGLTDLGTCGLLSGCFETVVTDGSTTWRVSVAEDGGTNEIVVEVDNGTGSNQQCAPVSQSFVEIDLTEGTVAGEPCSALSFGDAPDTGYDIQYRNGDQLEGSYTLVVDNPGVADTDPARFGNPGDPAVEPALYAVTMDYDFISPYVTVNTTVRVAPGEPNE
ncbi:hypothetical protein ACKVMT_01525 [Halobacteriales archaeon Cl-PHB]